MERDQAAEPLVVFGSRHTFVPGILAVARGGIHHGILHGGGGRSKFGRRPGLGPRDRVADTVTGPKPLPIQQTETSDWKIGPRDPIPGPRKVTGRGATFALST